MDIKIKIHDDETAVTPIKIAEALISQSGLSVIELDELGEYLHTFARFDRDKKMDARRRERGVF